MKAKGRVLLEESDSEEEETSTEEEEMDLDDVRMMKLFKVMKKDGHEKMDVPMYGGKLVMKSSWIG